MPGGALCCRDELSLYIYYIYEYDKEILVIPIYHRDEYFQK